MIRPGYKPPIANAVFFRELLGRDSRYCIPLVKVMQNSRRNLGSPGIQLCLCAIKQDNTLIVQQIKRCTSLGDNRFLSIEIGLVFFRHHGLNATSVVAYFLKFFDVFFTKHRSVAISYRPCKWMSVARNGVACAKTYSSLSCL